MSSTTVSCRSDPYPFFLPATGPAFACPCVPGGEHWCQPGERRERIYLPFTTGLAGPAELQVAVYFGPAAIQVLRVALAVGGPGPAPTAEIVFSVGRDLTNIERYGDRAMSIVESVPAPGRHQLLVNDGHRTCLEFELIEQQAATAARELRRLLFEVHLERRGGGWASRYDRALGKSDPARSAVGG